MNIAQTNDLSQHPATVGRVAAKLFLRIADEWRLSESEQLVLAGLTSRSTLQAWRRKVAAGEGIRLSHDTLERLSYIAGICHELEVLFPDTRQWANWVSRPNKDFGECSALERMMGGNVVDLADVRRYLDAWRAAQFG